MNAEVVHPIFITKEQIKGLHFLPDEVLDVPVEIKQRKENAERGMQLGNKYKSKVKITFEDAESIKQVVTTIWGLTDMHVILKEGITIPLYRIYSVEFCP